MARIVFGMADTHRHAFRGCHKGNTLKCGCYCTMAATRYSTEQGGRVDTQQPQQQQQTAQHSKNKKAEIEPQLVVFIVHTSSPYCLL